MDLNRIVIFLRVVELGGFTRAAKALGLPTSSVSRSVSQLEEELGVRLLQRTTRTVRLTEAGEAYAARAQAGLQVLGEAEHEVRAFGSQLGGRVRVTAASDMSSYLADFAREVATKYPKIALEFVLTPRRLDLLGEGIDVGIRAGDVMDENLVAKRVGTARLSLYTARSSPVAVNPPKSPAELALLPFVVFRGGTTITLHDESGPHEVVVNGSVSADDMTFVWYAIRGGLGVGMLPAFIGEQGVADGLLTRVLPSFWYQTTPISVIMLGGRFLRPNVLAVRDELVASLKARDWWGPPGEEGSPRKPVDAVAHAPSALSFRAEPTS